MFIRAASTISYQPTFRNNGFSAGLHPLQAGCQLLLPDYTGFIPVMDRRRMSQAQKMSITCAIDCLQQSGMEQPGAIIVGTSMGCSVNTRTFLDKIYSAGEGPLSPTAFIVSTHNTIAGQIALLWKNHGYNMTYTQNTLSFEQSLADALLTIQGGSAPVLVGGVDEEENTIYNMRERLKNDQLLLTSGASFFMLSGKKNAADNVHVVDVGSFGLITSAAETTRSFLAVHNKTPQQVDLVLYAVSSPAAATGLQALFGQNQLFDYQQMVGTYFTNAAFALHYALDILSQHPHPVFGAGIRNVLVYNNLIPENLGLTLLDLID